MSGSTSRTSDQQSIHDQMGLASLVLSKARNVATERNMRRALLVVAIGGFLLGLIAYLSSKSVLAGRLWGIGTIPVIGVLGYSIIRDLASGRFGVDAVAFLSMSAALLLGEPLAGCVVAIMYAGGNVLEDFAVGRAERDLKSLVDRAPRIAHRLSGNNHSNSTVEDIEIGSVAVDDRLIVRGGEVIPVDGTIVSASATLDEAALTGEPIPVDRRSGDPAYSGAINAGNTFELQATSTAGESTYAGIVRMVTAAQTGKSPFIRLADRYALLLFPVTLTVAGLAWWISGDPVRGLAVLVAATPCPLILAAPVAFIAGVSQAARRGILVKGSGPLEALARTHTVIFDKTGTLTVGGARLVAVEVAPGQSADDALRFAASLEQSSHHVVAAAIVAAAMAKGLRLELPSDVREAHGSGLLGTVTGRRVRVGSHPFVTSERKPDAWAQRVLRRAAWRSALTVFVAVDDRIVGVLLMGDELRREAPHVVQVLRANGVARILMVTGDRAETAETMAAALDLDAVLADRLPGDKVNAVATEQRRHPTLMIGDGINDAPALAAANVGIALGARGASASSEAADIVILVDRLDRVSDAVRIARRTRRIALQSIVVGMALSGVAMLAAAFGWLPPVAGALTQEAIDVAVILNALRALGPGRSFGHTPMPASESTELAAGHVRLNVALDRLRAIADDLDDANAEAAVRLIKEAEHITTNEIVIHERDDETVVYPRLQRFLKGEQSIDVMSRAHREIMHLGRLLGRLADGLEPRDADRYLVRDAQRVIEAIEALTRLHSAQEEDIFDHAAMP
jgi:heavy metal translocating P-type ATPase